jgi:hypothetical protein
MSQIHFHTEVPDFSQKNVFTYTKELVSTRYVLTSHFITKTQEAQTQLDAFEQYKTYLSEVDGEFDKVEHMCLTAAVHLATQPAARATCLQSVARLPVPQLPVLHVTLWNVMSDLGDGNEPLEEQMKKRLARLVYCLAQGSSTVTAHVSSHVTMPQLTESHNIVTAINPAESMF